MSKVRIKKGDTVIIIAGRDKGRKGEVIRVEPDKGICFVKGINMVKKTMKKSKEYQNGAIVDMEGSINLSNVMLFCPKNNKGVRVGFKVEKDGTKKRVAKGIDYTFE